MKDARGAASPAATGGAGEQFEQHLAGLALGLLLVRGMPPVLTDTSVVEVHLQTGRLGWGTDDVLLVGERSDGSRRKLALQAKRSFRVSANDDDCRKTIKGMWNDYRADRFDESEDQLAVATLHGTSVLLRDLTSLLVCARASTDAEDFGRRLSLKGFLSNKAKEQNGAIRLILAEDAGDPSDDVYWRFLRTVNVLSFDLNTPTSQTEAWMLSLLQGCTADGSGNNTAARAAWAMLLASAGEGKQAAQSYARGDLPADLRERYDPISALDRNGLNALIEHGQTIRSGIRSTIGDGYTIERSGLVQALAVRFAEHRVVIVSGAAGSGKSALARQVLVQLEGRYSVLSFQAVEFATAHVDETLANAQTSLNLQRLRALLAGHDRKIVLVDGVERLLERSVRDAFSQLLQLAEEDPSTWIVLTVRDYSLETVRNSLIPVGVQPGIFEVPTLTDVELDSAASGVPALAQPLANATLRAFLRTPYLVDLASRLHWEETAFPASLVEFRRKVWQELIRDDGHAAGGMPARRERAFLELAWRRAVELRPFVAPGVDDAEALEALRKDSLIATPLDSSAVYSVTHDVLEDWGVLQRIEDRFAESDGSVTALQEVVGGYPAIRRGLRQWLAERFEKGPDAALALVLSAIDSPVPASYFRDDCVVAVLLSPAAVGFIEACRQRIGRGDFDLLDRVTHVLRVACKESPKWLGVPGLPSQMLVPTGPGWVPTLRVVLDLTDELLPQRLQLVLGLVEDWVRQIDWRNREPAGVEEAGAIAASGLSHYNLRIYGLELAARIVHLHLPVDTALGAVDVGRPGGHFVVQRAEVADAAPVQALARQGAELVLRDVQPAPVFRRVAELDATNQFPCPGRLEHCVEGALRVRVEVVADQGDLRAVGVATFQQAGDLQRPVRLRTPSPGRRLPPTGQRLAEQEDRGRASPFVLVIDPARPLPGGGNRRTCFPDQLHRLLIHAHDRARRVVRLRVGVEDLFHVRHELRIGLRRDHPVLDFPPRHPVFFSVLRTVSWLTDSTIANSTTRRANSRNDQLEYPFGGGPSRRAMMRASCSPSSSFGTGGDSRGLRSSARSNPSSTHRWRTFSTVLVRHGTASAICWSVHAGPSASACKRICARRTFSRLPLPLRTVCRQTSRSSAVSRTMYLFSGMEALSARDELPNSPNVY